MNELRIPKLIKNKIDLWHHKNQDFKESLLVNDRAKVESLLDEGYPFYLKNLLTDEEISQIGDAEYDDLADDFYKDLSGSLETLYMAEDKSEMLELLAKYLMFQTHEISYRFRKKYFSYTKNYDDAIKYAETLINTFGFMKSERSSWLLGCLYNENNDFFDSFYSIYKLAEEPENKFASITLTGKILEDGKYYNINSWKKHFECHFPNLVNRRYRSNEENDVDVYSVILLELIKYPLEIFENSSEKDRQKVKPIIDFLLEDFSSITGIENLSHMLIAMLFERERELLWELNQQAKNSPNKTTGKTRGFRRHFKSLVLETSLNKNKEDLNLRIEQAIGESNPEKCFNFFNSIGLPKERYQILESYVNLLLNTKSKEQILNKKINKI